MSKNTLTLTSDKIEAVAASDELSLVDFSAGWCGPCRALAPIIDEVASEYEGRVKVYTLDTDANPEAAVKYGVRGLPTVLLLKNGQVLERIVGLQGKARFTQALDAQLK